MKNTANAKSGFTLLELAIVLVIIGLITGGVLVGRDLIHAAEIRATITQVGKYNTAVNTFRGKYGYLPGDIPPSIASSFGLFAFTGANAGTPGYGDGSGVVNGYCDGLEATVFWRHLSDANLIEGSYGSTIDSTTGFSTISLLQTFPQAKLGGSNYFAITDTTAIPLGSTIQANFFNIFGMTAAGCLVSLSVTPSTGAAIDTKMDDGMPFTGRVLGIGNGGAFPGQCIVLTGPSTVVYNTGPGSGNGDTPGCYMAFQFQ